MQNPGWAEDPRSAPCTSFDPPGPRRDSFAGGEVGVDLRQRACRGASFRSSEVRDVKANRERFIGGHAEKACQSPWGRGLVRVFGDKAQKRILNASRLGPSNQEAGRMHFLQQI